MRYKVGVKNDHGLKRTYVNVATRVLLVIFVALFVYLLSILLMSLFIAPQSGSSMQEMMDHMMSFSPHGGTYFNGIVAATLGVGVGLITALLLRTYPTAQPAQSVQPPPVKAPEPEVDEIKIIRRVLSDDEKAIVDEVRRAGKITQDSLRFRLGWSKAKVSRILTNLDKMNLIQRERVGKTYNVFLTEKRRKD